MEWLGNNQKAQEAELVKSQNPLDAQYAALPDAFKKRMDRFRAEKPDLGREEESLEIFCCMQAAIIASALKTPEAFAAFHILDFEAQLEMVPDLDD